MRINLLAKVLNRREIPYTLSETGISGKTFKVTVSQNNDNEIGEERVSEEIFKTVEKGAVYTFSGEKRVTKNGIRIVFDSAVPVKDNPLAIVK